MYALGMSWDRNKSLCKRHRIKSEVRFGYKPKATTLIKVRDDILRSIDNKCSVILLLLNLSARI